MSFANLQEIQLNTKKKNIWKSEEFVDSMLSYYHLCGVAMALFDSESKAKLSNTNLTRFSLMSIIYFMFVQMAAHHACINFVKSVMNFLYI